MTNIDNQLLTDKSVSSLELGSSVAVESNFMHMSEMLIIIFLRNEFMLHELVIKERKKSSPYLIVLFDW